jgi:hypothetical protein
MLGVLVGYVLGYFVGAFLGCYVIYPEANLCGLVGVFYTGPVGMVAGGIVAYVKTGRGKQ